MRAYRARLTILVPGDGQIDTLAEANTAIEQLAANLIASGQLVDWQFQSNGRPELVDIPDGWTRGSDIESAGPVLHEYVFDAKLLTALRVSARTEEEARQKIAAALQQAMVKCGEIDGESIEGDGEVEGDVDLLEVDGEMPE